MKIVRDTFFLSLLYSSFFMQACRGISTLQAEVAGHSTYLIFENKSTAITI